MRVLRATDKKKKKKKCFRDGNKSYFLKVIIKICMKKKIT